MIVTRLLRLTLCIGLIGGSLPAGASPTRWACWYNLDQHVACILQRTAAEVHQASMREPPGSSAYDDMPAAESRYAGLPPIVRLLRTRPVALRGHTLFQ